MKTGTSNNDKNINDGLNDKQLKDRNVSIEDVDQKGLMKRHKVNNQTIFDQMLIYELIELAQNEAAHLFIEDLSISGASIPSVDIETFGGSPFHKKGDMIAERHMVFSEAYRSMLNGLNGSDDTDVKSIMSYCYRPYEFPKAEKSLAPIALVMNRGLTALANHYHVGSHRDPRRILRSQIYTKPT